MARLRVIVTQPLDNASLDQTADTNGFDVFKKKFFVLFLRIFCVTDVTYRCLYDSGMVLLCNSFCSVRLWRINI